MGGIYKVRGKAEKATANASCSIIIFLVLDFGESERARNNVGFGLWWINYFDNEDDGIYIANKIISRHFGYIGKAIVFW